MALQDIYSQVQPDEDPYFLAASLGFACEEMGDVDLFETTRDLWNDGRGDLMLTFLGGWLAAKGGTEEERKELVLLAVHGTRLVFNLPSLAEDDRELAEDAINEAERWASGVPEVTKESVAEKNALVKARIDEYTDDDVETGPLYGVYHTCLFVERFSVVYEGDDSTYAAMADLIRSEQPPPAVSEWNE